MKKLIVILLVLCIFLTFGGVLATWSYPGGMPDPYHYSIIKNILFDWKELPTEQVTISGQFAKILNDELDCPVVIDGVTYTNTYDALIAAFDNPDYSSGITLHNNSYIGTMQPDGSEDTGDIEAVKTLFGDILTTQDSTYSLMIKREPIDGKTYTGVTYMLTDDHGWYTGGKQFMPGSEMILFSTNADLTQASGTWVTVYATVLTRDPLVDENGKYIRKTETRNNRTYYYYYNSNTGEEYSSTYSTLNYPVYEYGDWYNLYEDGLFAGRAQIVGYAGGETSGSFQTETWVSTEQYGTAPAGSALSEVIQAVVD